MTSINYIKNLYIYRVILNIIQLICEYLTIAKHSIIQYAPNIVKDEIIYFDFETTGLNPFHDKIIEYSFMIDDDTENTFISELVNPETKMEKKITEITGIHPDMLENKKNINTHIEKIYNFISGVYNKSCFYSEKKYLVAHNATTFDKIFLNRELNCFKTRTQLAHKRSPYLKNIYYIDSLLLARKIIPGLYSYSLKSLCKEFNISPGTHRALDDVIALKNVFERLLNILSKNMNVSVYYLKENPGIILDYIEY